MTPDAFQVYWKMTYPEEPPIGYRLRETSSKRWFRIHTLPGSKRYADSAEECAEILRRHTALLAEVMGATPFVLVLTGYSETPEPVLSHARLWERYPNSQHFATIKLDGGADPEIYWHLSAKPKTDARSCSVTTRRTYLMN